MCVHIRVCAYVCVRKKQGRMVLRGQVICLPPDLKIMLTGKWGNGPKGTGKPVGDKGAYARESFFLYCLIAVHQPFYPSIYLPSTHQFIHPPIHPFTHLSIHPSFRPPIHPSSHYIYSSYSNHLPYLLPEHQLLELNSPANSRHLQCVPRKPVQYSLEKSSP